MLQHTVVKAGHRSPASLQQLNRQIGGDDQKIGGESIVPKRGRELRATGQRPLIKGLFKTFGAGSAVVITPRLP